MAVACTSAYGFGVALTRRVAWWVPSLFLMAVVIGFVLGLLLTGPSGENRTDRIVAMSWGEGRYGPAFYGAQVYLSPESGGYRVKARVHLGRGNGSFFDCGELGIASSESEAVRKWGTIEWRTDGIHIGRGTNDFFRPKDFTRISSLICTDSGTPSKVPSIVGLSLTVLGVNNTAQRAQSGRLSPSVLFEFSVVQSGGAYTRIATTEGPESAEEERWAADVKCWPTACLHDIFCGCHLGFCDGCFPG